MKTKTCALIFTFLSIALIGLGFGCTTPIPNNPGGDDNTYSITLDTTFDGDGIVKTDISNKDNIGKSVAIQNDGKIVVVGHTDNGNDEDVAIVRYNIDGTLDTTFNGTGIVTLDINGANDNDYLNSIAIQSDGKIVAAGSSGINIVVLRYNSNGLLDTTFGSNGFTTTNFLNSSYGTSLAIQNDGKIVVAGNAYDGSDYDIAIVRYNINGTLDTTFDGDGIVYTDFNGNDDEANSIAIQSDGKIVVAGYSNDVNNKNIAIARYDSDGTLDTTFDVDGIITKDIGGYDDEANSIAIQTDGKIVVAGYTYNGNNGNMAILRYNINGTLDTTFDGDGIVTKDIGGYEDNASSIVIQSDGKIVVAGYTEKVDTKDILLVRYNKQ